MLKLLQRIQSHANFLIGWALPIIHFYLKPCDFSGLIDHVDGWMRNTEILCSLISRIAQAVFVDDLVFGIRENRELDLTFAIR